MPLFGKLFPRSILAGFLALGVVACTPEPERKIKSESEMWTRVGTELATLAARQRDVRRVLIIRQEVRPEFDLGPGQERMTQSLTSELADRLKPDPEVIVVTLPAMPPPDPRDLTPRRAFHEITPAVLNPLVTTGVFDVVVSLLGPPTQAPASGQTWPPIICFTPEASPLLAEGLRKGVVTGAIAPRRTSISQSEGDWFELRYTIVTPESVDAWAAP